MMRAWWLARRNAFLSDPRFQRFSLRFAPTRRVARKHARRLFDLVAGFTYSQTLYACVELDLFAKVAAGPIALADLAGQVDLPESGLERLVGAAVALDLLERTADGRIVLGVAGAAMVGNPAIAAMVAHHRDFYADLADPVALLRSPGKGALSAFWAYTAGHDPEAIAAYSALMAASLQPVAAQLLDAYDIAQHRRLLDVAGGEGCFLAEVRHRAPAVYRGLFDLPAVIDRARKRLGDTAALHGGDFRFDALPGGYDCMSLVRVLHDHDDDVALALLRSIHRALVPGGALLIVEPMLGAAGAAPVGATYFSLYFQAMGRGRARSADEIGTMLEAAGFERWQSLPTTLPLVASAIQACKA